MMKKLSQMKNKLFKFLPKRPVASMAAYQNPKLSPSVNTKGCRLYAHKVSMIPKEARRKYRSISFSAREPSSPKVSCMGQVQCKKKRKAKRVQQTSTKKGDYVLFPEKKVPLRIFKGSGESPTQSGKALVLKEEAVKAPSTLMAPSLGSMKKFASGRGSLSDFDVTVAER